MENEPRFVQKCPCALHQDMDILDILSSSNVWGLGKTHHISLWLNSGKHLYFLMKKYIFQNNMEIVLSSLALVSGCQDHVV